MAGATKNARSAVVWGEPASGRRVAPSHALSWSSFGSWRSGASRSMSRVRPDVLARDVGRPVAGRAGRCSDPRTRRWRRSRSFDLRFGPNWSASWSAEAAGPQQRQVAGAGRAVDAAPVGAEHYERTGGATPRRSRVPGGRARRRRWPPAWRRRRRSSGSELGGQPAGSLRRASPGRIACAVGRDRVQAGVAGVAGRAEQRDHRRRRRRCSSGSRVLLLRADHDLGPAVAGEVGERRRRHDLAAFADAGVRR